MNWKEKEIFLEFIKKIILIKQIYDQKISSNKKKKNSMFNLKYYFFFSKIQKKKKKILLNSQIEQNL